MKKQLVCNSEFVWKILVMIKHFCTQSYCSNETQHFSTCCNAGGG